MEVLNIGHRPELQGLVNHLRHANQVIVLQDENGQDLATITPARRARGRLPKGKPLTEADSLFNIVGIGRSGRSDISANKHTYLTEAYLSDRI